ncbi:hypothetical protein [Ornithinimicrobium flavum]|uniref:hypothetical protein n=1 Tax=Ornithinimicrobium flavum TaxID=1288636 RepID=UPI00187E7972|nr:hypothetical protein [Ornithinimicrobium flavum]
MPQDEVLGGVALGTRVVVRSLIEGGERATDVVGELTARDATSLTVTGRRGPVRVEVADVVVAKVVPAVGPRWRVASFLRRAGVAVLDLDALVRVLGSGDDPGSAAAAFEGLVEQLASGGVPVVVLARGLPGGVEEARAELARIGLGGLAPSLLHADHPAALDRVHDEIERRLGRTVGRGTVHYTSDRAAAVEAARASGWQGRILTPP